MKELMAELGIERPLVPYNRAYRIDTRLIDQVTGVNWVTVGDKSAALFTEGDKIKLAVVEGKEDKATSVREVFERCREAIHTAVTL